MANVYTDPRIISAFNFGPAASFTEDDKGGSSLTINNGIARFTDDFKTGSGCANFNGLVNPLAHFSLPDADLSTGFPGKDGESNDIFTIFFWIKYFLEVDDGLVRNILLAAKGRQTDAPADKSFDMLWVEQSPFRITGEVYGDPSDGVGALTVRQYDWYHVGWTANPFTGESIFRVYNQALDSVAVTTVNDYGTIDIASDKAFYFGAAVATGTDTWPGYLDELVIAKGSFTVEEMEEFQEGTFVGDTPSSDIGPYEWFPFEPGAFEKGPWR